jgi:hypothetical protein
MQTHPFWALASLTDAALLGALHELVGSSRQVTARLVAHLAEVEHRRLHLDAGFGSMFAYCVGRLRLSEDEACRRIEVARLARQYPGIYPRLAAGQLSLSVVALLKPHLSEATAEELLQLVSGSSVERTKELLAARFPHPDVASTIRKLPERPFAQLPSNPGEQNVVSSSAEPASLDRPTTTIQLPPAHTAAQPQSPAQSSMQPLASPRPIVEPLSKGRYKVQFTADTQLKEKLELARDLMRHTQPDGDLAPILSRALDLLIEQIMKRRFGARAARTPVAETSKHNGVPPVKGTVHAESAQPPAVELAGSATNVAPGGSVAPASEDDKAPKPSPASPAPAETTATTIPRATRRDVTERDGLRCTWQAPDGTRCNARAWLELDHRHPRARGGNATPENIRVLCRAHNRRAAEREYGRRHIEHSIARARANETVHEHGPLDRGAPPS